MLLAPLTVADRFARHPTTTSEAAVSFENAAVPLEVVRTIPLPRTFSDAYSSGELPSSKPSILIPLRSPASNNRS